MAMWKAIPLVLTLLAAGQAAAEPMEIRCGNTDVSIRERIAGCTAIIDGGQNLGHELSQAYANRGLAYTQTRDLARAGEDVEKAVQIDPNNVTCANQCGANSRRIICANARTFQGAYGTD